VRKQNQLGKKRNMRYQDKKIFQLHLGKARFSDDSSRDRHSSPDVPSEFKACQRGATPMPKVTDSYASQLQLLPGAGEASTGIYSILSSRNGTSPANDPPLVLLVKVVLTPTIVAAFILFLSMWDTNSLPGSYELLAAFSLGLTSLVFDRLDLYRGSVRFPLVIALFDILWRWLIVIAALAVLGFTTGAYIYFRTPILTIFTITTPLILLATKILARVALRHYIRSSQSPRTAVVVGANTLSYNLYNEVHKDPFLNIRIAGFFDDRQRPRLHDEASMKFLGHLSELPGYVKKNDIAVIYLCLPIMWQRRILEMLEELRDTTASIYFVPDIFMHDLIQSRVDMISGMPTIAICETPFVGARGLVKRLTDIAVALVILLLVSPVLLVIAISVKISSPGPVIFKQTRYGLDGQKIMVYKFRTMRVCENNQQVVQAKPNDDRVTRIGRFLRRTSLDELPQLVNVLQGSMSVVGPRPHAVVHNEMYRKVISGYMVRHKVKPGITGWAQVNGLRGETETLEKMRARVEHDLEYLRNWSLGLDFWIILKSFGVIWSDRNAY
jgi:putative colanic acid biosysnthesis UDP-glucose lipid carrier transferase